jgi:predicted CoA-binding protein
MSSAPDRIHDVLRSTRQPLDAIFAPKTIAVIGATEREHSVGRSMLSNLHTSHVPGPIFPINPAHAMVLGIDAYPTIADVPQPVDLAVIVTPDTTVPGIIGQCADAGVKAAFQRPPTPVVSANLSDLHPSRRARLALRRMGLLLHLTHPRIVYWRSLPPPVA